MNRKSMKEYRIWQAMKSRCYAPSFADSYYQKDGINVCKRWIDSFDNFLEDMGSIPGEDYSIERIDVKGDYCPENCKWIPMKDQQKNRRNVPVYTYSGKTMCLSDWAKELNMNYERIRGRLRNGCTFEEAINDNLFDKKVEINGVKKTVKDWCDLMGLSHTAVYTRISRGEDRKTAILKANKI